MKLSYKDKGHQYWLQIDAAKKRCTSITGLAGIPDDKRFIDLWKLRELAVGLSMSEVLLESVRTHHDDKNKLNELVEKAMTLAGANDKAELGTTVHRMVERVDKGEEIIESPMAVKIRANWETVIANAGLTVVPELAERIVVYPDRLVCGKLDRIFRRADGTLVLADLKTGQKVVQYPHSIAIQLALYANAPLIAEPWDGIDGETDKFDPLPAELNRKIGLIVHMPSPDKPATIHEVNILAGWKCVNQIIWPTVDWRRRRDLTRPLPVAV